MKPCRIMYYCYVMKRLDIGANPTQNSRMTGFLDLSYNGLHNKQSRLAYFR